MYKNKITYAKLAQMLGASTFLFFVAADCGGNDTPTGTEANEGQEETVDTLEKFKSEFEAADPAKKEELLKNTLSFMLPPVSTDLMADFNSQNTDVLKAAWITKTFGNKFGLLSGNPKTLEELLAAAGIKKSDAKYAGLFDASGKLIVKNLTDELAKAGSHDLITKLQAAFSAASAVAHPTITLNAGVGGATIRINALLTYLNLTPAAQAAIDQAATTTLFTDAITEMEQIIVELAKPEAVNMRKLYTSDPTGKLAGMVLWNCNNTATVTAAITAMNIGVNPYIGSSTNAAAINAGGGVAHGVISAAKIGGAGDPAVNDIFIYKGKVYLCTIGGGAGVAQASELQANGTLAGAVAVN